MSPMTQAEMTASVRLEFLRNRSDRWRRREWSARRRRRRLQGLAALTGALALFAPTAARADSPIRSSTTQIEAGCHWESDAGVLSAVVSNRTFDGGTSLQWWAAGTDPEDAATLVGEAPATWEGTAFSGGLTLHGADDRTAAAVYAGSVNRTGEATTESQRIRSGNVRMAVDYTSQEGSVDGGLEIEGVGAFDLGDCLGSFFDVEQFITWPRTSLDMVPEAFRAECTVSDADGVAMGRLWLDGDHHGLDTTLLLGDEDEPVGFAFGLLDNERGSIRGDLLLLDGAWEEVGTVSVALESTATGRRTLRHVWQNGGSRTRTVDLRIDGSIGGDDLDVRVVACVGQRDQAMERLSAPQGPSQRGRLVSNDAPDGAMGVSPGSRLVTSTRTTALDAEVPLSCWWDRDVYAGHTLWYRLEGTGDEVTVDTAGSGFNTVIAVYEVIDDGVEEISCVDDLLPATLQAAATIATAPGEIYLLQIGGFYGQFGQLKLAVR